MDSEEDYLQSLLLKERQKNDLLLDKLEEAHDEIDRCHRQIQSLMRQHQVESLHSDVEELQRRLEAKEAALQVTTLQMDAVQQRLEAVEEEANVKSVEAEGLMKKVKSLENSLDDLLLSHQSEGILQAEKVQLQREVEQLMGMLGSTKEYADFVQRNRASGGVTFLPSKPKAKPAESWVPSEALRLVRSYQHSQGDWATELVRELHALYHSREVQVVDRLKRKYLTQIADLKRQLTMRAPYDEVYTHKHVSTLKQALRRTQTQAKEANDKAANNQVLDVDVAVERTLAMARSVQKENLDLIQENLDLKKRLGQSEGGRDFSERRTISSALNGLLAASLTEEDRDRMLVKAIQDELERNVAGFAASVAGDRAVPATIFPD